MPNTISFSHHCQALCRDASPLNLISSLLTRQQLRQQHQQSQCSLLRSSRNQLLSDSRYTQHIVVAVMASTLPPLPETSPPPDVSQDLSSAAHVLEPIQEEGTDVLLYFLPDALAASSDYIPILKGIQSKCLFRLWVVLLDVGEMSINAGVIESSFDGIIRRVTGLGFPSGPQGLDNIFIGGHSQGAWESRSFAMTRAKGYIQLASTFHSCPDNLVQYPKPVLTLCGEMDGEITLAAIVKHAGDVCAMTEELGEYFVNAIKPVVIIPGMNHAQFSHSIPNKERGDLDSLIPRDEARSVTVDLISSFLTLHTSNKLSHDALSVLSNAVKRTNDRYHAFWLAIEEQSRGVKEMQLELASVEDLNIGVVHHEYKDNFIYSKPSIHVPSKHISINTYFSSAGKHDILKNLWVKMKSREAISSAFQKEVDPTKEEGVSLGAIFNQKTFDEALALVPDDTRRRFKEHGKKLRFIEDRIAVKSSLEWINSDVTVNQAEDRSGYMDVQASVLISPVKGMPERFAGMHYFKLLTIARAMEWIFMDCYR